MAANPYSNDDNLNKFDVVINPWFKNKFTYKGWGKAIFTNPSGVVEGPTRIRVSENGKVYIQMQIENLTTQVTFIEEGKFRILKFLSGNINSAPGTVVITDNRNHCSELSVKTGKGMFSANNHISFTVNGFTDELEFFIGYASFEYGAIEKAKYVIIPLINFILPFELSSDFSIYDHPLSLRKMPNLNEILDERIKVAVQNNLYLKSRIIKFHINDKLAFIQPILDYSEKKDKIKSGKADQCITALLVTEIPLTINELWFAMDYTNILSFAIGNKVGFPWIEYRDNEGKIIKRTHVPAFTKNYKKGYAVITEEIFFHLKDLLNSIDSSEESKKDFYRILINHLVRAQSLSHQGEDDMDLLCRTFDALGEEFGFGVQNLLDGLTDSQKTMIKQILNEAIKVIIKISKKAEGENKTKISRIADRVRDTDKKDRYFGFTAIAVMKKFHLRDVEIMNSYYEEHPNMKMKDWITFLSRARGRVIHDGYIPIQDGTFTFSEILETIDHLHDILVRIALKIIEYEGVYHPRMRNNLSANQPPDWVNENTTIAELGYGYYW